MIPDTVSFLSAAQLRTPHRRAERNGVHTHLERSFFRLRNAECVQWWDNGVAGNALRHPDRGPRLVRAFLDGVFAHGPQRVWDEADDDAWERLWSGLTDRTPALASCALAVFALHAPHQAERLVREGFSPHAPFAGNGAVSYLTHSYGSTPINAWAVLVDRFGSDYLRCRGDFLPGWESAEAGRKRRQEAARRQEALLDLLDGWLSLEPADDGQAHVALACLSQAPVRHADPHGRPARWRDALLARGVSPWLHPDDCGLPGDRMNRSALGVWLAGLPPPSRPATPKDAEWGEALLGATPPPGTFLLSPSQWLQLASLPDPTRVFDQLGRHGITPWPHVHRFWGERALETPPDPQQDAWLGALARMAAAHPPETTWVKQAFSCWFSALIRAARQHPLARLDGQKANAWSAPWRAWAQMGVCPQAKRAETWSFVFSDGFEGLFESLPNHLAVGAFHGWDQEGQLGAFFVHSANVLNTALFRPGLEEWVDRALEAPEGNVLRSDLWKTAARPTTPHRVDCDRGHVDRLAPHLARWTAGLPEEKRYRALADVLQNGRPDAAHRLLDCGAFAVTPQTQQKLLWDALPAWGAGIAQGNGDLFREEWASVLHRLLEAGWSFEAAATQPLALLLYRARFTAHAQEAVRWLAAAGSPLDERVLRPPSDLIVFPGRNEFNPNLAALIDTLQKARCLDNALVPPPVAASRKMRL